MSAPAVEAAATIHEVGRVAKNRSEFVAVSLTTFHGHRLVDIRVNADRGQGAKPTPKGVSLNVARLAELVELIGRAEVEARRIGWLDAATGGDA